MALTILPRVVHRFWTEDFLAEFHEFSSPHIEEDTRRYIMGGEGIRPGVNKRKLFKFVNDCT